MNDVINDKLTLLINPSEVRVYDMFEDDQSVLIKLKNGSTRIVTCKLEVTLPEDIVAYIHDNDDIREKYSEEFTIMPDGEHNVYVFLSNESDEDRTEKMQVSVLSDANDLTGEVKLHVLT
jgi:hypothetical protein